MGALHTLVGDLPIVPLSLGTQVDDHADLIQVDYEAKRIDLATNLHIQTAIVQHAEALVCTYGGFAYIGVLSGIPTLALYQRANFSVLHLDVLSHIAEQLPLSRVAGPSLINIAHLMTGRDLGEWQLAGRRSSDRGSR
jgi:hypothetical protein